jgi:predicted esterase
MRNVTGGTGRHSGQPIAAAGVPPGDAKAALILLHGRGGSGADMLGLARLVAGPTFACLAPEAADSSWYPYRFTEPTARNEPHLGSALSVLGDLVDRLIDGGMAPGRIALLGFSQGACLALELALRRGQRLGAVIGLSGGLIGDALAQPAAGARAFEGMPVVLGCSDHDPHIPIARVRETDAILRALGAEMVTRIYPGSSHDINDDEVAIAGEVLARLAGASAQVG